MCDTHTQCYCHLKIFNGSDDKTIRSFLKKNKIGSANAKNGMRYLVKLHMVRAGFFFTGLTGFVQHVHTVAISTGFLLSEAFLCLTGCDGLAACRSLKCLEEAT